MKSDGRVRYTKMVIKDGLLKLLKEKPIQRITVREICELAKINRATFYRHYQDAYDLLEQIENELFEEMSAMVSTNSDEVSSLTRETFQIIEKNIELCKVLFSENGDKMFLRRMMDISREKGIAKWRKQYPNATKSQLEYLYTFISSGSTAVIEQWVRTGMKERPVELEDIAQKVADIWVNPDN